MIACGGLLLHRRTTCGVILGVFFGSVSAKMKRHPENVTVLVV
jgi:hypothetical protein